MKQAFFCMVVGVCILALAGAAGMDAAAQAPQRAPTAGQVLLLMDGRPFGTGSIEDLLSAEGLLYDIASSDQMGTIDLSAYPAVIIAGQQSNAFYNAYAANADRFESYVQAGGYLEFHAGGWYGDFDGLTLPGGITIYNSYNSWNWINQTSHPLATGLSNPFTPNARAAFSGSVAGMSVIISGGNAPGGPATTIEYPWGTGQVVAFGQPVEYLYAEAISGKELLPNAIDYLAGNLAPNVYVTPGFPEGFGVAGQAIPYEFTILNDTGITGTFDLALDGADWPSAISAVQTGSLNPGESETAVVTVTVPLAAQPGDFDEVTLEVTSSLSPTVYYNQAIIHTTATSGDYGFVMANYAEQIVRLDRQLNIITGWIYFPSMSRPLQGALSPSGETLYASLGAAGTVAVIDTATNTVKNTIPVGSSPNGLAITYDGELVVVANRNSDNTSIIDTATQTVVATLSTGDHPYAVAAHPCRELAYVASQYSGEVYVIDTAALTVTDVIAGVAWLFDLAVSPNGQYVYVVEGTQDRVAVIDTNTNEVLYRWPAGGWVKQIDISPDGRLLYVADGSTSVSVLDALSGELLHTIALNLYYSGITDVEFAPAGYGPYAYLAEEQENQVITINTQTHTVVGALDVGVRINGLAYFPRPSTCLAEITLTPGEQVQYGAAGETVDYLLRVSNASTETRTIGLSLAGAEWPAALSSSSTGLLGPWESFPFTVTVTFPTGAAMGDHDAFTVEAADPTGGLATSAAVVAAVARPGYAFDPDSDRIWVMDTILHQPTGEYIQMPTGSWAWRGVLSADSKTLYASLRDTGQVAVIDLTAAYTSTLIPVGARPYEIALSPDGSRAFVVNHDDDSLSVIDTAALTVTQVITGLEDGPISVETSPCLDKIYIVSKDANSVSVLDGTTFSVTAVITAGLDHPWGMAISPLGDRAYVSSVLNMDVVVIDTASDTMVYTWTMNLPGSDNNGSMANLEVSPDGLTLYATDPALGLLYVVDTQTGEVTDQITVGASMGNGMAWDVAVFPWPDEGLVYVSMPYVYMVRAVDTAAGQVVSSIQLEGGPRGLALFPRPAVCGTPPAGSFTQSATTAHVGETVVFTATISAGVPTPTLTWNFGDGSATSSDLITSHAYAQAGVYTVTLSIGNPLGHLALTSTVTVENLRVYLPLALKR